MSATRVASIWSVHRWTGLMETSSPVSGTPTKSAEMVWPPVEAENSVRDTTPSRRRTIPAVAVTAASVADVSWSQPLLPLRLRLPE